MRILLFAPHFPPRYRAGVELYTERLAGWLLARHQEPEVVCVEQLDPSAARPIASSCDNSRGYPVHRLTLRPGSFSTTYHDPALEEWTKGLLESRRPDVVHLHSGYLVGTAALKAAQQAGVPKVVTLHDYWFVCPRINLLHPNGRICSGPSSAEKCAWCLRADRRLIRVPDRLTAGAVSSVMSAGLRVPGVSKLLALGDLLEQVRARRRRLGPDLASADLVLSPSRFVPDTLRATGLVSCDVLHHPHGLPSVSRRLRAARSDAPLRIGYLGQVSYHKGVHVPIEAIRRLPGLALELRIHGPLDRDVSYVRRLEALAAGDSRVRFLGPYSPQALAAIVEDLDVIVVPSLCLENHPTVILEAHAYGLPVVASRLGGIPELVRHEVDGLLVEPGNPRAMADAFQRLACGGEILGNMAQAVQSPPTPDEDFGGLLRAYEALVGVSTSGQH